MAVAVASPEVDSDKEEDQQLSVSNNNSSSSRWHDFYVESEFVSTMYEPHMLELQLQLAKKLLQTVEQHNKRQSLAQRLWGVSIAAQLLEPDDMSPPCGKLWTSTRLQLLWATRQCLLRGRLASAAFLLPLHLTTVSVSPVLFWRALFHLLSSSSRPSWRAPTASFGQLLSGAQFLRLLQYDAGIHLVVCGGCQLDSFGDG